jgi:uncharacterized surface protein with fasciclin (FAS1) repeats
MLWLMKLLSLSRLLSAWIGCLLALAGFAPASAEPAAPASADPAAPAKELSLTETLSTSGFKSFSEILTASGLLTELGETAYTCFAPSDEAIAAMPPAELKALRENPKSESTLRWVKYHFIKSEVCKKSDFGIVREIITWSTLPTFMFVTPTRMALNDVADIVKFDLSAKNGIIHGLSKPLDPLTYEREDNKKKK